MTRGDRGQNPIHNLQILMGFFLDIRQSDVPPAIVNFRRLT
jgi:hypothetical protein